MNHAGFMVPRTQRGAGAKSTYKMHYVYILKSLKDSKFYIGRSGDLKRRIAEHSSGKIKSTTHRRPLKLIFYEAFAGKADAIRKEAYFKTSKGKSTLNMMLQESTK